MIVSYQDTRNTWVKTELLKIQLNALKQYQKTGNEIQYDIYLKLKNFVEAEFR